MSTPRMLQMDTLSTIFVYILALSKKVQSLEVQSQTSADRHKSRLVNSLEVYVLLISALCKQNQSITLLTSIEARTIAIQILITLVIGIILSLDGRKAIQWTKASNSIPISIASTTGISNHNSEYNAATYWEEVIYGRNIRTIYIDTTVANAKSSCFYEKLENQTGQLTSALNNKPIGKLSSDTQVFKMEDIKECKVVELTNGKDLPDLYKVPERGGNEQNGSQGMEEKNEDGWVEV